MEERYNSHPVVKLKVNGIEYAATAYCSINDLVYISEVNFESEATNDTDIVLAIIQHHLIDCPNNVLGHDSISSMDLERYMEAYIASSENLRSAFEESEGDDAAEKFVNCLRKRTGELSSKIVENVQPALQTLSDKINITIPSMPQLLIGTQMHDAIAALTSAYAQPIQASMEKMAHTLSESINKILPDYSQAMQGVYQAISSMAASIQSPLLPEERKKELQGSFEEWGKLGWTLPPNAALKLFFKKPIDESDAYKKIQPYLNNDDMQILFEMLLQQKRIRKSDLKEAIRDYEDKRYKSCIMILFSLVDARIIRLQNKEKWRAAGFKGANKYFKEIDADEMVEMTFVDALYKCSILSSIEVVFKPGDNFREQPDRINRNFIDHGMLHRNVTQRDCKKLFLLLYNFNALLEDLAVYKGT